MLTVKENVLTMGFLVQSREKLPIQTNVFSRNDGQGERRIDPSKSTSNGVIIISRDIARGTPWEEPFRYSTAKIA